MGGRDSLSKARKKERERGYTSCAYTHAAIYTRHGYSIHNVNKDELCVRTLFVHLSFFLALGGGARGLNQAPRSRLSCVRVLGVLLGGRGTGLSQRGIGNLRRSAAGPFVMRCQQGRDVLQHRAGTAPGTLGPWRTGPSAACGARAQRWGA